MKKSILILFFVLSVSIGYSQQKETRNLEAFNELSVSEGIEVTLVKGSREMAEITADDIDIEEVITDVSGNSLSIYLDGNNYRRIDVEIRLTYRELEEISISSAAKVYGNQPLTSSSMEIELSSAGKGELVLDAGRVEIDISSAAVLELSGSAESVEVEVSSAGKLEAYDLECKQAEVGVSSAGSVELTVTERIDAEANSGGKIRYGGNPEKVFADSNSGGSVSKK